MGTSRKNNENIFESAGIVKNVFSLYKGINEAINEAINEVKGNTSLESHEPIHVPRREHGHSKDSGSSGGERVQGEKFSDVKTPRALVKSYLEKGSRVHGNDNALVNILPVIGKLKLPYRIAYGLNNYFMEVHERGNKTAMYDLVLPSVLESGTTITIVSPRHAGVGIDRVDGVGIDRVEHARIVFKQDPVHVPLLFRETRRKVLPIHRLIVKVPSGHGVEEIGVTVFGKRNDYETIERTDPRVKAGTRQQLMLPVHVYDNEEERKELMKIFSDLEKLYNEDKHGEPRHDNQEWTGENDNTEERGNNNSLNEVEEKYWDTYAFNVLLDTTNPFIYLDENTIKKTNIINSLNAYAQRKALALDSRANSLSYFAEELEKNHVVNPIIDITKHATGYLDYLYDNEALSWVLSMTSHTTTTNKNSLDNNHGKTELLDAHSPNKNNAELGKQSLNDENKAFGEGRPPVASLDTGNMSATTSLFTPIALQAIQQAINNSIITRVLRTPINDRQPHNVSGWLDVSKSASTQKNNHRTPKETSKRLIVIEPVLENIEGLGNKHVGSEKELITTSIGGAFKHVYKGHQVYTGFRNRYDAGNKKLMREPALSVVVDTVQSCVELEKTLGKHGTDENEEKGENNDTIVLKKIGEELLSQRVYNQYYEASINTVGKYENTSYVSTSSYMTNDLLIAGEHVLLGNIGKNSKDKNIEAIILPFKKRIVETIKYLEKIYAKYSRINKLIVEAMEKTKKCRKNNTKETGLDNNGSECDSLAESLSEITSQMKEETQLIEKFIETIPKTGLNKQIITMEEPYIIARTRHIKEGTKRFAQKYEKILEEKNYDQLVNVLRDNLHYREKFIGGENKKFTDVLLETYDQVTSDAVAKIGLLTGMKEGVVLKDSDWKYGNNIEECVKTIRNVPREETPGKCHIVNNNHYPIGLMPVGYVTEDKDLVRTYLLDELTSRVVSGLSEILEETNKIALSKEHGKKLVAMDGLHDEIRNDGAEKVQRFIDTRQKEFNQLPPPLSIYYKDNITTGDPSGIKVAHLLYPECVNINPTEDSLSYMDAQYVCIGEKMLDERGYREHEYDLFGRQKENENKEYFRLVNLVSNYYVELGRKCGDINAGTDQADKQATNKEEPTSVTADESLKKHGRYGKECREYLLAKEKIERAIDNLREKTLPKAKDKLSNSVYKISKLFTDAKTIHKKDTNTDKDQTSNQGSRKNNEKQATTNNNKNHGASKDGKTPNVGVEERVEKTLKETVEAFTEYVRGIIDIEKSTDKLVEIRAKKALEACRTLLPLSMRKFREDVAPLIEIFSDPNQIANSKQTAKTSKKEKNWKQLADPVAVAPTDSYALWWLGVLEKQALIGMNGLDAPLRSKNGRNTVANIPEKTVQAYTSGAKTPVEHLKNAYKASMLSSISDKDDMEDITLSIERIIPSLAVGVYPSLENTIKTSHTNHETIRRLVLYSYEFFLQDPFEKYKYRFLNQYKKRNKNSKLLGKYSYEKPVKTRIYNVYEAPTILMDFLLFPEAIAPIEDTSISRRTEKDGAIKHFWDGLLNMLEVITSKEIREKTNQNTKTRRTTSKKEQKPTPKELVLETLNKIVISDDDLFVPLEVAIDRIYGSELPLKEAIYQYALKTILKDTDRSIKKTSYGETKRSKTRNNKTTTYEEPVGRGTGSDTGSDTDSDTDAVTKTGTETDEEINRMYLLSVKQKIMENYFLKDRKASNKWVKIAK